LRPSKQPATGPDHFHYSVAAAEWWKEHAVRGAPMKVKLKKPGRPTHRPAIVSKEANTPQKVSQSVKQSTINRIRHGALKVKRTRRGKVIRK
jgi:hypothetical protein